MDRNRVQRAARRIGGRRRAEALLVRSMLALCAVAIVFSAPAAAFAGEPLRMVAHGDSITEAYTYSHSYEGAPEVESWASRAASGLDATLPNDEVTLYNEAVPGYDVNSISVANDIAPHKPHIVAIMIGTNDAWEQSEGLAGFTTEAYRARLEKLVDEVRAIRHYDRFNGGKPLVVLISPPWACKQSDMGGLSYQLWRDQAILAAYRDVVQDVAREKGVIFVDSQTPVSTLPAPTYYDYFYGTVYYQGVYMNDGVHLASKYQALVAEDCLTGLAPYTAADQSTSLLDGVGSLLSGDGDDPVSSTLSGLLGGSRLTSGVLSR